MTVKNKQIDGQLLNEVLESSDYLEMNKFLFQCYGARLWTPEKINLTDAQISRMEQLATATPSALRIYDIYFCLFERVFYAVEYMRQAAHAMENALYLLESYALRITEAEAIAEQYTGSTLELNKWKLNTGKAETNKLIKDIEQLADSINTQAEDLKAVEMAVLQVMKIQGFPEQPFKAEARKILKDIKTRTKKEFYHKAVLVAYTKTTPTLETIKAAKNLLFVARQFNLLVNDVKNLA